LLAGRLNAIARGLAPAELRLGPLSATRDFVDVRDAARAVVLLATASKAAPVVNVGSGRETPVRVVLDLLLELAGMPQVRVSCAQGRRTDVPRSCADVRRLAGLGFVARHELPSTLREMLRYFDSFPAGERRVHSTSSGGG
jgi:nucleoside-diphosphate-sugar epimerase